MPEQLMIIGQLILAAILGGMIGYEREKKQKAAGIRTHALVAFGATLFTVISAYAFVGVPDADPTRIMSQILPGVGFLGAGLIIFRDKHVQGLTTAAGLWACAAIGMAVGIGWYTVSILGTAVILLILHVLFRVVSSRIEDAKR